MSGIFSLSLSQYFSVDDPNNTTVIMIDNKLLLTLYKYDTLLYEN